MEGFLMPIFFPKPLDLLILIAVDKCRVTSLPVQGGTNNYIGSRNTNGHEVVGDLVRVLRLTSESLISTLPSTA